MLIDLFNPYAWMMRLRRSLYHSGFIRSYSIDIPVIAVGNLSSGGTGKTPMVLHLAQLLEQKYGKKVAVVLRGYKRTTTGLLIVRAEGKILPTVAESGDEARLYADALTMAIIICDENRVRGAKKAKELGAEVILLDDAFQHLVIKRDLNILLINAIEGIPAVIPFSKGRETVSSISDADAIIITNSENARLDIKKQLREKCSKPLFSSVMEITEFEILNMPSKQVLPLSLKDSSVLALSGLGNPESFECSVFPLVKSMMSYRLADHSAYDRKMIYEIMEYAKKHHCDYIITTTKDGVKLLEAMKGSGNPEIPILIAHSQLLMTEGKEQLEQMVEYIL